MSEDSEYIHTGEQGESIAGEWRPINNPGDKRQLYDEVIGSSGARPVEQKPKVPHRLPLSVRRCCAHEGDEDYGWFDSSTAW